MRKKQKGTGQNDARKMNFCCHSTTKGILCVFSRKKISECAPGEPESIDIKWPLTLLRLIRFFVNTYQCTYLYPCQERLFMYTHRKKIKKKKTCTYFVSEAVHTPSVRLKPLNSSNPSRQSSELCKKRNCCVHTSRALNSSELFRRNDSKHNRITSIIPTHINVVSLSWGDNLYFRGR